MLTPGMADKVRAVGKFSKNKSRRNSRSRSRKGSKSSIASKSSKGSVKPTKRSRSRSKSRSRRGSVNSKASKSSKRSRKGKQTRSKPVVGGDVALDVKPEIEQQSSVETVSTMDRAVPMELLIGRESVALVSVPKPCSESGSESGSRTSEGSERTFSSVQRDLIRDISINLSNTNLNLVEIDCRPAPAGTTDRERFLGQETRNEAALAPHRPSMQGFSVGDVSPRLPSPHSPNSAQSIQYQLEVSPPQNRERFSSWLDPENLPKFDPARLSVPELVDGFSLRERGPPRELGFFEERSCCWWLAFVGVSTVFVVGFGIVGYFGLKGCCED